MPPFSVAWLVTQTDNGTGNQLTKVHHLQAPHPPDPPPPLHGADQHIQSEMTVTELFASSAMSDS